eukprot:Blabericola_migrator_1__1758@NODE_1474_length_4481_cov_83_008156_g969_i0_p2_GENE_NODE_1474_length_4481_cov_83_008156_g969_i0NODE_1474_length_4481_cov_83_008156_g969_i0_p2_ORF_typecomplete_len368_score97_34PT/PF04886_12/4_7_NODE_1474_length_4481_cov_83_008156_g969_i018752978
MSAEEEALASKLINASVSLGSLQIQITVRRASTRETWPPWSVHVNDGSGGEVCLDARALCVEETCHEESPTSMVDDIVLNSLGFTRECPTPNKEIDKSSAELLASPFKIRRTNENHHDQQAFHNPVNLSPIIVKSVVNKKELDVKDKESFVTQPSTSETLEILLQPRPPLGAEDPQEGASEGVSLAHEGVSEGGTYEGVPEASTTQLPTAQLPTSQATHPPTSQVTHPPTSQVTHQHPDSTMEVADKLLGDSGTNSPASSVSVQRGSPLAHTLSVEEAEMLRRVEWPHTLKPGTDLPTLYCHWCYLKERAFRKIEATSPHGNRVYFRHRACSASYGNGEAFPKELVDLYVAHFLSKRHTSSKKRSSA